jgi:hypothetical protein
MSYSIYYKRVLNPHMHTHTHTHTHAHAHTHTHLQDGQLDLLPATCVTTIDTIILHIHTNDAYYNDICTSRMGSSISSRLQASNTVLYTYVICRMSYRGSGFNRCVPYREGGFNRCVSYRGSGLTPSCTPFYTHHLQLCDKGPRPQHGLLCSAHTRRSHLYMGIWVYGYMGIDHRLHHIDRTHITIAGLHHLNITYTLLYTPASSPQ